MSQSMPRKKNKFKNFERAVVSQLADRMNEPRSFIQILSGPRQTGKTTAIKQTLEKTIVPQYVVSAEGITRRPSTWLEVEWRRARALITESNPSAILFVDEIQNVAQWSSAVKALWDEDTWNDLDLRVVLSGSSSLLIQKGLSESLMGRFELLHSTHWNFAEMKEAFNYSLDDFLLFGGYPGAAKVKDGYDRWYDYMTNAIIEPTINKDTIQMEDIRKPALLKALFVLGCQFSAQELSYRKILGQLNDKGNATTIAHYLNLLSHSGLLCGLQKYDEKILSTRKSSPRLMVYDTSLMAATAGSRAHALLDDSDKRGHLVESSVGAYLLARSKAEHFEVFWWREGSSEVDFVIRKGEDIIAIEVKSGRVKNTNGLLRFYELYPKARPLVIGDRNTSLEDFLLGKIALF